MRVQVLQEREKRIRIEEVLFETIKDTYRRESLEDLVKIK